MIPERWRAPMAQAQRCLQAAGIELTADVETERAARRHVLHTEPRALRGLRYLLRLHHQQLELPEGILNRRQWLPLSRLSEAQRRTALAFGYAKLNHVGRRRMLRAMACVPVERWTDRPTDLQSYVRTRAEVNAVNAVLRVLGRDDERVRMPVATTTAVEEAWLRQNEHRRTWYVEWKDRIANQPAPVPATVQRRMLILLRNSGDSPTTIDHLHGAIAQALLASLQHHNSVTQRGFASRSSNGDQDADLSLGRQLAVDYAQAARELARLMGGSCPGADEALSNRAVWGRVRLTVAPVVGDTALVQTPFSDVVAGSDAEEALMRCKSRRERLLVLLCTQLGMRIGAVAQLRLTGCLCVPFDEQQTRWMVRDSIRGMDKNRRINEWDLQPVPMLRQHLEDYVNEDWRARWTVDETLYLFPADRFGSGGGHLHVGTLRRNLMMGGPCVGHTSSSEEHPEEGRHRGRTMPSACLSQGLCHGPAAGGQRSGGGGCVSPQWHTPGPVQHALHHHRVDTTMTFYDKRSHREILAKLRPPERFCTSNKKNDDTTMADAMARALECEMAMNEILRQQLTIFWDVCDEPTRDRYRRGCEARNVPVNLPVPSS